MFHKKLNAKTYDFIVLLSIFVCDDVWKAYKKFLTGFHFKISSRKREQILKFQDTLVCATEFIFKYKYN